MKLHRKYSHKEFVVVFNFLGKDSIRYHNHVKVDKCVFNNLKLFKKNKKDKEDVFDMLEADCYCLLERAKS